MIVKFSKKSYRLINQNENYRQFATYFVIGGLSALSDIIFLFILVEVFHLYYLFAATISFVTISTIAFFFHNNFTFKGHGKITKRKYAIFLTTAVTGLVLSLVFLSIFVEIFNAWYLFAAVLTKFIVLLWNFTINKYYTFRKRGAEIG